MTFGEQIPPGLGGHKGIALLSASLDIDHIQKHGTQDAPTTSINQEQAREEATAKFKTYSPKRKANGILLLPAESSIIAEDTKGPMNAEVFPIYIHAIQCQKFVR